MGLHTSFKACNILWFAELRSVSGTKIRADIKAEAKPESSHLKHGQDHHSMLQENQPTAVLA